jgi:hypothetical protein
MLKREMTKSRKKRKPIRMRKPTKMRIMKKMRWHIVWDNCNFPMMGMDLYAP